MIKLFTFAPDRLNLNGDQGNLLVLQKHLDWAQATYKVVALNDSEALRSAADWAASGEKCFLLVGHGSFAAMKSLADIRSDLEACIEAFKLAQAPALIIGSSYEALKPSSERSARVSQFAAGQVEWRWPDAASQEDSLSVFGYVNSNADLPIAQADGSIVFTLLHGPVLAKSPELVAAFLEFLGVAMPTSNAAARVRDLEQKALSAAEYQRLG